MTPEQFCCWLLGYSTLRPEGDSPSVDEWRVIQERLHQTIVKVVIKRPDEIMDLPTCLTC